MKLNIFIKSAVAASLALMYGCTGDFEHLNTNPVEVNSSDLPFAAQFLEPMSYSYPCQQNMFQFWTNLSVDIYGGYFESPNGGFPNSRYNVNVGHCGGLHENFMQHIFNNTRRIIRDCDNKNQPDFAGVMRVVEVYNLLTYTDAYGPVPYTSVIESDLLPERPGAYAYDSQETIYGIMIDQLNKAIEGFKENSGDMKNADIWCGGDRDLWKQVANQLKLRIALRMYYVNEQKAKTIATEAVNAGVLTDKDILIAKGYENEMWLMFNWGDSGANASLVEMMKGYRDPRLPMYFTYNTKECGKIAKGTEWLGLPPGCDIGGKPNMYSGYSGWAGTFSMPQPIMFAAEGYFLRAEAKLHWGIGSESVEALYNKGIEVSIKNQYDYRSSFAAQGWAEHDMEMPSAAKWPDNSDAAIAAYINNDTNKPADYVDPATPAWNQENKNKLTVKWNEGATEEEKLQRIITQKWIANFPLSNEAWAEFRRTGYPVLFKIQDNKASSVISNDKVQYGPRRLPYSTAELNSNTAAVEEAVSKYLNAESSEGKGDNIATKLWWDKNPRLK